MNSIRHRVVDCPFTSHIVVAHCQTVHGAGMPECARARGRRRRVSLNPSSVTDLLISHSRIARWGARLLILSIISVRMCWAEENWLTDLAANSPFGMMSPVSVAEPTMEFRGYVFEEGILMFSLAYPDAGGRIHSAWVGLHEPFADCVVRSFDQATDTVQVEHRGQRLALKLKLNRVQLLHAPERPAAGVEPAAVADEKARLEAITTEIRRRRSLRQANAENHDLEQP